MKSWRLVVAATLFAGLVVLGLTVVIPHAPATQINQTADYTVRLAVDATGLGNRTVTVDLAPTGAASPTSTVIDRVVIVPTMPLDGMASENIIAQQTMPGHYVATGVQFSMAGIWDPAVQIRAGGKEEVAHFTVTVR